MLYLHSLSEAEEIFKALSTPMRLRILELVYEDDQMSMNDLAKALGLTNSAISLHVSKLEDAGLIAIHTTSGKRGVMKIVRPVYSRLLVDMAPQVKPRHCYTDDISVGHFISCEVHPTCGLANPTNIIGDLDNPKVFSYPERFSADIVWIGYGSLTYSLPNRLNPGQSLNELQISFEISSECPEFNQDYPSDIHFSINGIPLGKWISPGDYGARRGIISPYWWPELLNQYGLLKSLIINENGTFIDGTHNSSIDFTFSVPQDTPNCGGLTLFGENFGDYSQAIRVKAYYDDTKNAAD